MQHLTSKTRDELATEYGVSVKTFCRWLKKHKIIVFKRERICPKSISEIYAKLGCPKVSDYDRK